MRRIPTLHVDRDRGGKTVSFRCAHCRRRHTHGALGIVDGSNPHRVAHCWRAGSPFAADGYHLVLAQPKRAVTARLVTS